MATTWAMAKAMRVAGDGEGESDGGNRMEAAMKASDGDEGDGEGNSGGWRVTVTRVEGKGRW
jgi:hypothetical protein